MSGGTTKKPNSLFVFRAHPMTVFHRSIFQNKGKMHA